MLHIPAEDLVLFICSPSVLNLDDLNRRGLYLSDIPLHVSPSVSNLSTLCLFLCVHQAGSSQFILPVRVLLLDKSRTSCRQGFLAQDVGAVLLSSSWFTPCCLSSGLIYSPSSPLLLLSLSFFDPSPGCFLPAAKRISIRANSSEKREKVCTRNQEK